MYDWTTFYSTLVMYAANAYCMCVERHSPGNGRLLCSVFFGRTCIFFLCVLGGSCKSSFVWSPQEDHCSLPEGWRSDQRWDLGVWNADGLCACMANGQWDGGQDLMIVCEFVCTTIGMQWVDYSAPLAKNKPALKGLDTQSSSLKQSNLFIWWFLICCFSASFHCTRLFSVPGCRKINVQNTSCFCNDWPPAAKDEKGHYESN